jgi:UDP-galactopyranose mutase
VIVYERTTDKGDPYYPVLNERNRNLFAKYKALSDKEEGVHFVGRLANYKYFNMDAAIKNALEYFDEHLEKKK